MEKTASGIKKGPAPHRLGAFAQNQKKGAFLGLRDNLKSCCLAIRGFVVTKANRRSDHLISGALRQIFRPLANCARSYSEPFRKLNLRPAEHLDSFCLGHAATLAS